MILLNSIKNKILIFAILATLIPSLGLGLLSFWQNETMITANVSHQLRTLASDANRELEYWLKARIEGLRSLSGSDAVINGVSHYLNLSSANTSEVSALLPQYLRLVQEKLPPLLELTVLAPDAQMIASSVDTPKELILPDSWPSEGGVIVQPHPDEVYATATVTLAVPVLSLDNRVIGTLVAVVDLQAMLPHLMQIAGASPGELVLLDLNGRPLLGTYEDSASLSMIEPQVLQDLRAQTGEPMNFDGHWQHPVFGLVEIAPSLSLIVVAERERADIYQAWTAFRDIFLMLIAGLTLLVALVAWRMGRSIVTPLESLTTAAARIADGDLSIQLPVRRRDELGHLTQVFNQMADNLRHSHQEFETASLALVKQNQLLGTLSITDSLTGLYNRKKLDDILADQLARYQRNQRQFSVLLLDIDHFKILNDNYGHLAGDYVLARVAKTFSQSIRSIDYAARYGGEEFVIVLPETSLSAAQEMAERIRAKIQTASYEFNGESITVTLSVGVADSRQCDDTAYAIVARADKMLYEAKRAGRNQVRCAD